MKNMDWCFFFTVDWGCIVILNRCKKCIHITNEDTDQTPTSVAKGAWKVTASEGSSDKSHTVLTFC